MLPAPAADSHGSAVGWIARSIRAVGPWQLFGAALLLRLPLVWFRSPDPIHTEDMKAGLTLAKLGYLGDPFAIPTGLTAHVAPAYPALIAVVRSFSPSDQICVLFLSLIFAVVTSVNIALLPSVGRSLRLPTGAGDVAALLWLFPCYAWMELSPEHETPLIVLALLLVVATTSRLIARYPPSGAAGAALGLVTGAAAHITPAVLPVAVLMSAAAAQARGWNLRTVAIALAGALLAFGLAIAPYTLRNHRAFGEWFFMRDDLGIELAMSYGARAHATMDENAGREGTLRQHPSASVEEAEVLRDVGEVSYNHMLLRESLQWIMTHPAASLKLLAERALYLVLPRAPRWYQSVLAGVISVMALAGAAVWWRSSYSVGVRSLVAALIGYLCVYLLLEHDIRYMYPALVLESLLAGCAAVALWRIHSFRRRAGGTAGASAVTSIRGERA